MFNKLIKLIPIVYKDLPDTIKGRSMGLWIEIDNKYKEDEGLLAHERTHCKQFFRTLGLHGLMYKFSDKYRYKVEVEAFGYSLSYGNRSVEDVKNSLKGYYGISDEIMVAFDIEIEIAIENARKDLKELGEK